MSVKVTELSFEPLNVLYNRIEDLELREERRTIWGDLTPHARAAERAERDGVPATFGLFIQSKDGKVTDSLAGNVGRMSGRPADRFGQYELRSVVDAFLIGAATLRADRAVGAPGERELLARRRQVKGNAAPLNVFFSASGNFPSDASVFRDPEIETLLVVPGRAAEREAELRAVADDVWVVDDEAPLREMWRRLRGRGVETIGFEGGPKLMGLALRERLVHELLLTHSPLLLGGPDAGFAAIDEPLRGVRTEPLFLGLDETANLLFERSLVVYD